MTQRGKGDGGGRLGWDGRERGGEAAAKEKGGGQVTVRRHLTDGRGNAEFNSNFPSSAACPVSHPHSSHSPAPVFTSATTMDRDTLRHMHPHTHCGDIIAH